MGVNAYSRGPVAPAFQSNYLSQHVGLPLDYIQGALQAKQEKYDHFLQGVNGMGTELMGIQGIVPSDAAYVSKAREGYNKQLQELSQQDGTRPEVQRAYQNLVQQVSGDKTLNAIKGNYAQMGAKQAQAQKLKADGKYHDSQGVLQNQSLQNYEAHGGAAGGASLQLDDFTPEVDVMKEYNDIYSAMKPSAREALGMLAAGNDGAIAYKMSHGGIDAQQAFQTARAALDTHRNSQAGRQKFMDAKAQGATDAQAHAYVAQQLYSRGGAYTFSKSSTNADGAYNMRTGWGRADRKEKEKEKKEAPGPVFMPYGQAKPDLGKEQTFDKDGNVVTNPGMVEGFEAGYGSGAQANQDFHTKVAMGLQGTYTSLFGSTAEKKGLSELIGYKTNALEKSLTLRNQLAASRGLPQVSAQQHYNNLNVFQPMVAPMLTTKKELGDADAMIVKSGLIKGMTIHDEKGEHLYNDLIKEGDEVTVTTDPNTAWRTEYSAQTIGITITSKDGKSRQGFVDAGSQYDYLHTPRSKQDVDAKNARLRSQAITHGSSEGEQWKWDEKNKRPVSMGMHQGTYAPDLDPEPLFTPVIRGK